MSAGTGRQIRFGLRVAVVGLGSLLAGCAQNPGAGLPQAPVGTPPVATSVGGPPTGAVIGNGSVRVALILPLTAAGSAGAAAQALRNAAEMALSDFSTPDIAILVKDDGGTAEGAQAATQQALSEGAELIIGPLFADAVRGAASVARPAGRPIIAFSTDTTVATRGVYLMSITPQSTVERIVQYALRQGKRSFAAFVPENGFGQVTQAAFQETVAQGGGRVIAIERFPLDPVGVSASASRLAGIANQIDAIFVPDPFDGAALQALATAGIDLNRVQVLGSGNWSGNRGAAGIAPTAIYAAPDSAGFRTFAQRYRARFNSDPNRLASLSYVATTLAAALVRESGAGRYSEAALTNTRGFNGVDGLFRFRADGTPQRGLAILRADGSVVEPAPRSFDPRS